MKALPRPPVKQREINHIKELCLNFVAPPPPPTPHLPPPLPPSSSHSRPPPPPLNPPCHPLPSLRPSCLHLELSTHCLTFPTRLIADGKMPPVPPTIFLSPFIVSATVSGGMGAGTGGGVGGRGPGGQKGGGGRGTDINFFLHSINTRKSLFCIFSCLDDVSESIWVSI